ncbi:MAG: MnmA/TRMU family protein, partial [Microthrixaceae bacterium]
VVAPYVADHAAGRTPNPCIECNRHLKFDRLLRRADALGFTTVATGHHARVVEQPDGTRRISRGADLDKDQSYVLHMLDQPVLQRVTFPVGELTKQQVRAEAERLGLVTADKPDSQDVCFITAAAGRTAFLGERIPVTPGRVVDRSGSTVGAVPAVELVTIGQRHGLGSAGGGEPRYAIDVDVATATVTVGSADDLLVDRLSLTDLRWTGPRLQGPLLAQVSAHGRVRPCRVVDHDVVLDTPARRVAPGQSVVLYDGDEVVGAGQVA